ncbi:MAG: stage III sporulation AC/AD family protein [Ruminococcus sp.]|nr:stage III sporulation AC/AD family protein [Ruminococcus sp.]
MCDSIFAVLLRCYCTEQSLMIAIAACAVVMIGFVTMVQPIITQVQKLFADAGISSDYISLIFKALAICFITQITCDICRDSGETAIASGAEIWGRGAITVMALPLIEALVETISDFL